MKSLSKSMMVLVESKGRLSLLMWLWTMMKKFASVLRAGAHEAEFQLSISKSMNLEHLLLKNPTISCTSNQVFVFVLPYDDDIHEKPLQRHIPTVTNTESNKAKRNRSQTSKGTRIKKSCFRNHSFSLHLSILSFLRVVKHDCLCLFWF